MTKKKALALLLTIAVMVGIFVVPSADTPSFSDVPANHWAFNEIEKAVDDGITTGYADGTFKPTNSVSYAHFSAFIARAFFPSTIEQYKEHNPDASWQDSSVYALEANNIYPGTKMATAAQQTGSYDSVLNQSITRYDMAQIMYNVLKLNVTSMPAGKSDGIGDWSSVPAGYQDAVSVCYALGVLNGQSDGNFGGNNYMNRAQGCVVISRLENYIENGTTSSPETPVDEEPVQEPETPAEDETPAQTEGTLANGKAATEENVLAMLEELKEEYPEGSSWGENDRYTSSVLGSGRECAGYAYMISDRIFGSLPQRTHKNYYDIKPGDIIEQKNSSGQTYHWSVVTTSPVDADGYFRTTGGNVGGGLVTWEGFGTAETMEAEGYSIIHTRYPA